MKKAASWTGAKELAAMRRLRTALKRSSKGQGLAAALVAVFVESKDKGERDAARRILLGSPVDMAVSGLAGEGSPAGELLRFVSILARTSSTEASRS